MPAAKTNVAPASARRPEKRIGPFHNGIGIAIWLNTVETDQGTRYFRSITLSPRRYRDQQTGGWRDAPSFRPVDLAVLALAIESAREYCSSTPLPGQTIEGDEYEELGHQEATTQTARISSVTT